MSKRRDTPGLLRSVVRGLVVLVLATAGAALLAALLPGFDVDGARGALSVVITVGLVNALLWPALKGILAPIGVLTLGLGALLLNAAVIGLLLDALPGVDVDGFGAALITTIGLTAVSAGVWSLLSVNDEDWFDRYTARTIRRARGRAVPDTPGVVFVQLDGMARPVLERAMRSGDAPTLHSWVRTGSHHLVSWVPEWSCQTGVSQCGILQGDVSDMPAFRWFEKSTGKVLVSNHPKDAAEIERRHSTTEGLLAHDGSSYGNLFSGGAERSVLTMSGAGRKKEGRIGAGYAGYFARPYQAFHTLYAVVAEVARERRAASDLERRDVQPRVHRGWTYALLRAFTTVISRDVCLAGVLEDMAEGRSVIYVDFLGFDEVSHHSGPERHDTLRVVRELDRDVGRIARAAALCPRRYEVVVLSDHGQTQGATFADRYGERLADLVARYTGSATTGRSRKEEGQTESTALLHSARGTETEEQPGEGAAVVLASGNLGLVYLRDSTERLTLEEIERRHPDLVKTLATHPGIGFVLVRSEADGSLVLGPRGRLQLATGEVDGEDPLAPFGPHALEQVRRVDGYGNVADLMVNSLIDEATEEVAAFEDQVSSHGGLGGDQQRPFLLYPSAWPEPQAELHGPVAVHRQLKAWLGHVGHPVSA